MQRFHTLLSTASAEGESYSVEAELLKILNSR
jgi:hypothetical protein